MNRNRRTRILIEEDGNLIQELEARGASLFPVVVREAAHLGLMMNPVRESAQNSLFYLGETLVTRARVTVNQQTGLGLISGEEPEKAYHLAVIDAVYSQLDAGEKTEWDSALVAAETKIEESEQQLTAQLNRTKVSFETMEVKE